MPARRLQLIPDGNAEITTVSGERVTLASSISSPPGSTLQGTLEGMEAPYRIKVRSCRRVEGERFQIEGKLVNLTRAQRQHLA